MIRNGRFFSRFTLFQCYWVGRVDSPDAKENIKKYRFSRSVKKLNKTIIAFKQREA